MSAICGFCGKLSAAGTPVRRVVTKVREKRMGGTEIVEEKNQCSSCYDATPEAVAARMADGRQYLTAERK